MAKCGMIGAGSWGTALAHVLCESGNEVTVWSISPEEVDLLNTCHEQKQKLPGVVLPDCVRATGDIREAVEGMDIVVLAVPSPFTRSTARAMAPYVSGGQRIVSVAKGIEDGTLLLLSEVIEQEIPQADIAVMCGPTHAEEVGRDLPTAIVVSARSAECAAAVQDVFMDPVFRVYTSADMRGMQIGAALKNVVALAAGIADGLGYGDNTKAALITRGIAEITRLGVAMGGRPETFAGLTGTGDLIVTCASMHSRNRRAGILIGQGRTAKEAMDEVQQVVEGVYSARAARDLAVRCGVEIPIIEQVCAVLFENKDPADAVRELMLRDKKDESPVAGWDR